MLYDFLQKHQKEVLDLTEKKTLELAGDHPSSDQLKRGLPVFLKQLIEVIHHAGNPSDAPTRDLEAIAKAADECDEPAMAEAARQPEEALLAKSAGLHGAEMCDWDTLSLMSCMLMEPCAKLSLKSRYKRTFLLKLASFMLSIAASTWRLLARSQNISIYAIPRTRPVN